MSLIRDLLEASVETLRNIQNPYTEEPGIYPDDSYIDAPFVSWEKAEVRVKNWSEGIWRNEEKGKKEDISSHFQVVKWWWWT